MSNSPLLKLPESGTTGETACPTTDDQYLTKLPGLLPWAANRISRRRQKHSKGAVLLETGLVFVIFAFMLMGAFDFAQFLFIHQALVDRARTAARWGALSDPTNTSAIQNMVLYNQITAPSGATSGIFGLTLDMVKVTTQDVSSSANYRLVVLITNYPYLMISPIAAGTYNGPNITISFPIGATS
jgi:Flp pilus assembly protein TadG